MLKILSLPIGMDACSYYRIRQPLAGIHRYTESDTYIIDLAKQNMEQVLRSLPDVDVVFCRPGSEKGVQQIQEIKELKLKCKWVLDIDDNYDAISPYSEFYRSYGIKEFKHGDIDVWKNGEKGFSIMANQTRRAYLEWLLREADMVTVTTQHLAEWASKFNKNVYVNKNTIDFNQWWRLNNKVNKPLKVIWQGSPSHYEDWYTIKEPMNKLMKEFDFTVYMLGSNYTGIFDEENRSRVISLPWVPFEAHSYRMMSLQPDIAVIPLADLPFNWYKSSIKWYEMSAMGIPSVVSNVIPYADDINSKNSMPYSNQEEFYNQMKAMLTNKGLRANIGNAAYNWVKENVSLEKESIKLNQRLEELCKS